ncbi:C-C chemokine receptor type 7-like [Myxocyprinus asiaticus]|uniref:C-C chemokine receptor type 7-like n=1 Tax=Myxocyprinus asiaticus TaxID=70543 RepID=UPI002223636F|nr:C-C chemokine receptor type 7-like [Myxocyprinus asiaticus]XP_051543161.1 C-C chemokine receptor type 7-like [Myxocyprinus asiaticus]
MESYPTTKDSVTIYPNYDDDYANSTTEGNFSGDLVELCEASRGQQLTITVIQTTVFLIVFILGIVGNGLVIATFALYRRLRLRCMTDVFLFFLALSDMLLLLTLPLQTGETLVGSWVFGEALCKMNRGMYAINTYSGLLLLACISVDRYLVVVRTKAVRRLNSGTLCYGTLSAVAVAVTSVILSLPDLRFSSVNEDMGSTDLLCNMNVWADEGSKWKLWAQVSKIAGFCIPCVAMVVCYGAIGRVLVRAGGNYWRRQRTLRLMALLVVLFLLFQLPYTVVLLLRIFTPIPGSCDKWTRVHFEENLTRNLAYVRCCLNPLLYALVGVRFRNDIIRLLMDARCACSCISHLTRHYDNGSSVTPSSYAPNMLSHQSSAYLPAKNTPASAKLTAAADTSQTLIYPVSAKRTSVIGWCHQ